MGNYLLKIKANIKNFFPKAFFNSPFGVSLIPYRNFLIKRTD
jgi:hypothetical protein